MHNDTSNIKKTIKLLQSLIDLNNSNKQATLYGAQTFIKVLDILTTNPAKEYSMSDMARELDINKPTTNAILKTYADANMLQLIDTHNIRTGKVVKITQLATSFINNL